MSQFFNSLLTAVAGQQAFALGIISGVKGSSPQSRGAKALFFADGRIEGTLGGGCLEAEVRERARRALRQQQAASFELVLDHDFGWDDGLICGGKVSGLILPHAAQADAIWREVAERRETRTWGVRSDYSIGWSDPKDAGQWLYQETVSPQAMVWIAGSGHVAQAVARLALQLDFGVTVFDDRPEFANHSCFPVGTNLRVDDWSRLLKEPIPDRPCFGLIVTRGHQHDAFVLQEWVHRPFVFLGMIGSQRKKRLIFSQFLKEKLATEDQLNRVRCPVGIDIHAVSVQEIAVSVVAQLIQCRAGLSSPTGAQSLSGETRALATVGS